ncbi:MAG: hypothetical protein ABJB97_03340 [Acidobacteriota bacterium]
MEFVPVRMVGVVTAEVGTPRNDGSPGSSLYKIPIKIEPSPAHEWGRFFAEAFDHPSQYTSMHRPGIASVSGDRIVLDGTTMEELEKTQMATLKLAVAQANQEYIALLAARRSMADKKRQDEEKHRREVEEAAKKIKFD